MIWANGIAVGGLRGHKGRVGQNRIETQAMSDVKALEAEAPTGALDGFAALRQRPRSSTRERHNRRHHVLVAAGR